MTKLEKKMHVLGLRGKPMYLMQAHVRALRAKFPDAVIVRIPDPAPMISGYGAYMVENWKELAV